MDVGWDLVVGLSGASGRQFGGLLGAVLGPLGASFGPFGGLLGRLGGLLWASWGLFGASWGFLGASSGGSLAVSAQTVSELATAYLFETAKCCCEPLWQSL